MKCLKKIMLFIPAVLLFFVCFFQSCQAKIIAIQELKGINWERHVGTSVIVEGIFVRDPLPMLVTDLKIVLVNKPMLFDQYLLLTGDIVEEIDPLKYGGAMIHIFGNVKAVEKKKKNLLRKK